MKHLPHTQKILDEGIKCFHRWQADRDSNATRDNHSLGLYHGFRMSLFFLQLYGPDDAARADAESAFLELSEYGNDHHHDELPEHQQAFTSNIITPCANHPFFNPQ